MPDMRDDRVRFMCYHVNRVKDKEEHPDVVRCKDCRYCDDLGMSGLWCRHPDHRHPMSAANEYLGCRPDDYCSDGKRRRKTQ